MTGKHRPDKVVGRWDGPLAVAAALVVLAIIGALLLAHALR